MFNTVKRRKQGMLSKCLLSIKGRSCNQTQLVHQYMTKKTPIHDKENHLSWKELRRDKKTWKADSLKYRGNIVVKHYYIVKTDC